MRLWIPSQGDTFVAGADFTVTVSAYSLREWVNQLPTVNVPDTYRITKQCPKGTVVSIRMLGAVKFNSTPTTSGFSVGYVPGIGKIAPRESIIHLTPLQINEAKFKLVTE